MRVNLVVEFLTLDKNTKFMLYRCIVIVPVSVSKDFEVVNSRGANVSLYKILCNTFTHSD